MSTTEIISARPALAIAIAYTHIVFGQSNKAQLA